MGQFWTLLVIWWSAVLCFEISIKIIQDFLNVHVKIATKHIEPKLYHKKYHLFDWW